MSWAVPGLVSRRPAAVLVAVLALAALLAALPAGRRPFWSSDEARFALLARDILDHDRWLTPELRGRPYVNKPQLYFWSVALVSWAAGGVTEVTAAIPSVVSAVVGVAGTVAIGRLLWGWPTGLLAGLILATTPHHFVLGHQVISDVMLNAWLVWALYCLLRAARAGWGGQWVFAFYVCVGGGLLTKGPAALAALVAAVAAAVAVDGRRAIGGLRPALGAVTLAVIAIPWMVPYFTAPRVDYVGDVLLGHYLTWYFRSGGVERLMTIANLASGFLPWTLFLAGATWWWRRAPDPGRRWLVAYTLTLWLVLMLSGTQRARYLLPLYPGLALLTAEFLTTAAARGGHRQFRVAAWAVGALGAGFAVVFGSSLVWLITGEDRAFVPDAAGERALMVALFAAAGTVAAVAGWRRAPAVGGLGVALVMAAMMTVEGIRYPGRYAAHFDVRGLAEIAAGRTPPGATVIGYPDLKLSYDFYLRRPVVEIGSPAEMTRIVERPPAGVIITSRRHWTTLAPAAHAGWRVLGAESTANRLTVVVGVDGR